MNHHGDGPEKSSPRSCAEEARGGLTTSKPGVVDSAGRVYNDERTLRLRADTALFTLRSEPLHAILDAACAEDIGAAVTSGVTVEFGLVP
jgi:hypothetical protein